MTRFERDLRDDALWYVERARISQRMERILASMSFTLGFGAVMAARYYDSMAFLIIAAPAFFYCGISDLRRGQLMWTYWMKHRQESLNLADRERERIESKRFTNPDLGEDWN